MIGKYFKTVKGAKYIPHVFKIIDGKCWTTELFVGSGFTHEGSIMDGSSYHKKELEDPASFQEITEEEFKKEMILIRLRK